MKEAPETQEATTATGTTRVTIKDAVVLAVTFKKVTTEMKGDDPTPRTDTRELRVLATTDSAGLQMLRVLKIGLACNLQKQAKIINPTTKMLLTVKI
jgi:hypothetical protein